MANPYTAEVTLRKIVDRSYAGVFEDYDITSITNYKFQNCTGLTKVFLAKMNGSTNAQTFNNCTSLQTAVFPLTNRIGSTCFKGCTSLASADIGQCATIDVNGFQDCSSLTTLVMRKSNSICALNGGGLTNTPYDQNGSGGTIYIPKALYDHLGDGTSLDYKAATRWSTIDAYNTITWAKIEGSYYETHYADGTLIPTS